MKALLLILIQCYFAMFPDQANEALDFVKTHRQEINTQLKSLTTEERKIAISIVAPEISQYSSVTDFLELRTLFIMYRNFGRSNFSVGYFSMKPKFIESLENEIMRDKDLKKKHGFLLPKGNEKQKRETRLMRLSETEWQLKYLLAFIDVVKKKTKNIKFQNSEEKLRYWATLYNSGFYLSPDKVKSYQQKKFFPHGKKTHNYADIAVEFYNKITL